MSFATHVYAARSFRLHPFYETARDKQRKPRTSERQPIVIDNTRLRDLNQRIRSARILEATVSA